jgi:hypothetical protein
LQACELGWADHIIGKLRTSEVQILKLIKEPVTEAGFLNNDLAN